MRRWGVCELRWGSESRWVGCGERSSLFLFRAGFLRGRRAEQLRSVGACEECAAETRKDDAWGGEKIETVDGVFWCT
jgi:hypothetical protein